jgi:hypothetical protein
MEYILLSRGEMKEMRRGHMGSKKSKKKRKWQQYNDIIKNQMKGNNRRERNRHPSYNPPNINPIVGHGRLLGFTA